MSDEQKTFENMSIDEVMTLIENEEITAQEALEIERQGKNRKTLIGLLEKMLGDPGKDPANDESKSEPKPEKMKVKLLKNIKYNKDRYKIGEEIEIDSKDEEAFVKAGIIKG
jgi:hypothetical protein